MRRRPSVRATGWTPEWVSFANVRTTDDPTLTWGSGLYRDAQLTTQHDPFNSLTVIWRVRNMCYQRRTRFWSAEHRPGDPLESILNVSSGSGSEDDGTGNPAAGLSGFDSGAVSQLIHGAFSGKLREQTEYVLACSLDATTGAMISAVLEYQWRAGVYVVAGLSQLPIKYPEPDLELTANLWWVFGGNYKFAGQAGYFWLRHAADDSAFMDLTDSSVLAALRGNPEDWSYGTPDIWFQGTAAEWNSGVNRGGGGDFAMEVPVQ